ncbi:O-methylsterigmatocystin oxidoreductase [Rhizoctonia solani]|uniref:O-methylsterigmatocystin oxidoreductase n=1 Tax=Rhizoctonia solani TaxID=456999 RepID=A0A0K6G6T5_9AGAM|nr:O-methylsterigmatocystin oxidoreductase [Rhizoctonia solani]
MEPTKRVLSIQSHVVHGYVGNKAATFPLQLLGWDVDAINTVQFSNHAGYRSHGGSKTDKDQLIDIFSILEKNEFTQIDALISGYVPGADGLSALADFAAHLKTENPNLLFVLDPGSDTTVSSLKTFVLAMLLFPECQAKAQGEIDRVIGSSRLPTFDDKDQLPYVNNLINEVMRWQPVTPLAVPHACTQDDVYRNYRIPKGAIVIGNVWSMSRNAEVYKNPEDFNPDRFLDPQVPKIPAFGFGRRLCPGIHYAEASIFITVTSILAAYTITKAKDENGEEITPSTEGVAESVVYHPKPFKCVFTPRSEKHRELILAEA